MKILYLITELFHGGAENCLCAVAERLHRSPDTEIRAVALYGDGVSAKRLRESNIPVDILGFDRLWKVPSLLRFRRILSEFQPDILHSFLFHANMTAKLYSLFYRDHMLVSSVRVAEKERFMHPVLESLTALLSSKTLCVSGGVARFMCRCGIPAQRMRVIPNGVDSRVFFPGTKQKTETAPLLILTVANLRKQKDIGSLLAVLPRLAENHHIRCRIVGDGPRRKALETFVRRQRLTEAVEFLGRRHHREMPDLMREADIFVLPSRWEGMSNALLEAMASGLPVVASAVEGSDELISNGKNGMLTVPGSTEDLKHSLQTLICDPILRKELSRNARHTAEQYSWNRIAKQYRALYRQLVHDGLGSHSDDG